MQITETQEKLKAAEAVAAELRAQVEAEAKAQRSEAVAAVREQIKGLSITAEELGLAKKVNGKGVKVAPKYRDPLTGKTWTGRGKTPAWIGAGNKDAFLISQPAVQ